MVKDKEFTKWILGLGYLLLAIVILVNFIRQGPEARGGRTVNLVQGGPAEANPDLDQVKAQLEAERALSRDLRKMVEEFQQAYGVAPGAAAGQPFPSLPLHDLKTAVAEGIPAIASHLSAPFQPRPSPFVPGRNPYLSFLPATSDPGRVVAIGMPSEIIIRCDPQVPLLMQGSGHPEALREARGPGWRLTRSSGF